MYLSVHLQERLFHARMMVNPFTDFTWPTDPEADYVCDKSACYESDYGSKGYYDECCYGHYETDQLLNFVDGDKTTGFGPTNQEIIEYNKPMKRNYAMPYVYDDFTWSHCESSDVAANLKAQKTRK
jgi:hypothetical protein